MAAAMAQALNDHDCLKRSTDMPLFFGRKEKDTITARHLIKRIDRAKAIATWNAERTCNELYMILREKALVWYESITDDDIDLKDWDVVKKEFRLAATTVNQAKAEGMADMGKFFKHQLFLASLSDGIRDKVLEAKKDTFAQSL
jgi:hypothetical protein